jgi:hypothetical protein
MAILKNLEEVCMISYEEHPHKTMDKCQYKICRFMNGAEETLTIAAIYPVYGTMAGCTKICLGSIQIVIALSISLFGGLPMVATGDKTLLKYSWSHTKHGLGNVGAGIAEGIPGLGASIAFREKRMPYSALA